MVGTKRFLVGQTVFRREEKFHGRENEDNQMGEYLVIWHADSLEENVQ